MRVIHFYIPWKWAQHLARSRYAVSVCRRELTEEENERPSKYFEIRLFINLKSGKSELIKKMDLAKIV